jgi:hypothetical protein
MSENVVKVCASKCFGYVAVIQTLAQLVEYLTDDTGDSGSNRRLISCIFFIHVTAKYVPLHFSFRFSLFFFFFTKILNIFKCNQKRWFHSLQFNVTIYKYKIRRKKYDVCKHTFSETQNIFILLYNVYDLHLKIVKAFFKYWHEK